MAIPTSPATVGPQLLVNTLSLSPSTVFTGTAIAYTFQLNTILSAGDALILAVPYFYGTNWIVTSTSSGCGQAKFSGAFRNSGLSTAELTLYAYGAGVAAGSTCSVTALNGVVTPSGPLAATWNVANHASRTAKVDFASSAATDVPATAMTASPKLTARSCPHQCPGETKCTACGASDCSLSGGCTCSSPVTASGGFWGTGCEYSARFTMSKGKYTTPASPPTYSSSAQLCISDIPVVRTITSGIALGTTRTLALTYALKDASGAGVSNLMTSKTVSGGAVHIYRHLNATSIPACLLSEAPHLVPLGLC